MCNPLVIVAFTYRLCQNGMASGQKVMALDSRPSSLGNGVRVGPFAPGRSSRQPSPTLKVDTPEADPNRTTSTKYSFV